MITNFRNSQIFEMVIRGYPYEYRNQFEYAFRLREKLRCRNLLILPNRELKNNHNTIVIEYNLCISFKLIINKLVQIGLSKKLISLKLKNYELIKYE